MASVTPLFYRVQNSINVRSFSTTASCSGKRNFRSLPLYGFRGGRAFIKRMKINPDPDIPVYDYGVRLPGYIHNGKFNLIPEMVPELIVPDLTDFKLKPYVSYKVDNVTQSEFTAKNLFDAIYSEKIYKDFDSGNLNEDGSPKNPSDIEKLTEDEAMNNAKKVGSDIFRAEIVYNDDNSKNDGFSDDGT